MDESRQKQPSETLGSFISQIWMNVTNVLCCEIRSFPGITDYFILFYFILLWRKVRHFAKLKKNSQSTWSKGTFQKISRKK
jgi:hypothetical protein